MRRTELKNIFRSIKRITIVMIFVFSLIQINQIQRTDSFPFFSDREKSEDNIFSAGTWDNEVEFGDLVINEIMWMGSQDDDDPKDDGPNDQWIELKNVSDKEFRIKDWYLEYKTDSGSTELLAIISNNRVIKPGEFYLLTHYGKSKSAIDVNPDQKDMDTFDFAEFELRLFTKAGVLIDVAGDGSGEPDEGNESLFYSMERNDEPGDGADYANWHTCEDASSTFLYWDDGRSERGTPGYKNLSENDSSAKDKKDDETEGSLPGKNNEEEEVLDETNEVNEVGDEDTAEEVVNDESETADSVEDSPDDPIDDSGEETIEPEV